MILSRSYIPAQRDAYFSGALLMHMRCDLAVETAHEMIVA